MYCTDVFSFVIVDCSQPLFTHIAHKRKAIEAHAMHAGVRVGFAHEASKMNRNCRHLREKLDLLGSYPCYRVHTLFNKQISRTFPGFFQDSN